MKQYSVCLDGKGFNVPLGKGQVETIKGLQNLYPSGQSGFGRNIVFWTVNINEKTLVQRKNGKEK